jgi:hypothetical protein
MEFLQKESQNTTCTCTYTYKYINGKTKYPLIQQCDMAEVIHLALPRKGSDIKVPTVTISKMYRPFDFFDFLGGGGLCI